MQTTTMRKWFLRLLDNRAFFVWLIALSSIAAVTRMSSDQILFLAPWTSSASRSDTSKLADIVSVKDFGAKGDWNGTTGTDDTAAFQAAFANAGGRGIYIPGTTAAYKVSGTIAVSTANTRVFGDGPASKIFMAFTSSGPTGGILFDVTASGVEFDSIAIDSTGTVNSPVATINHYAIRFHGTSGTHLTNLRVRNLSFTNLPWNDTLGAVVTTHAVYVQWADNVTVRDTRIDNVAGAAVFFSGVTNGYVLNNKINDTGWYSIQLNDLVSNSRISGNAITGTLPGDRVWGGSINAMSNSSTGTACGGGTSAGCAVIKNVEIDHNYISGVHSYTAAVHIESSSHIFFHDNLIEKITLSTAAQMLTRYGQHFGSGTNPFYPDGSPAVYVRPYVRPADVPANSNEGPLDHVDISRNVLIAGSVGAIAVYADAQDNGSGTLAYSDTLSAIANQIQSLDTTHYFSNGIAVHGQQGGWKNVTFALNQVSGFPDGTSPNLGLIGATGLTTAPVLDTQIIGNTVTVVGGTPASTTQLGIGVGAFTTRTRVAENNVNSFWTGIRTFTNSVSPYIGTNVISGSLNVDYLLGVTPVVPFGVTPRFGTLFLTGRSSDLAATNVVASAGVGEYRLCATARTTTSGTGTTATLNLSWTDEGGVRTDAAGTFSLASLTVTGQINKCDFIHVAAATNIQVSVTSGTYGTSAYALSATVERLN